MARVYLYVVARDFGFAPNPFHGVCTLATCKPRIRSTAQVGDWVFGLGGSKLKAVGRCIFAMRVTDAMSFDTYWFDPDFFDKRPVPNGSRTMKMGDNVYHRAADGGWVQEDSHHSRPDGSPDLDNLGRDTSADRVLISRHFYYFGQDAPIVSPAHLDAVGYENRINHRVYDAGACAGLIRWLEQSHGAKRNLVSGLPFQFRFSTARYSVSKDRIVT